MDLGLEGKVAIVTGSSRGIGRAIAGSLAAERAKVVLVARGRERLEAAEKELAANTEVLALELDMTASDAGEEVVARTIERFGRLDVLVNNVGGNRRKPFAETTDEDWAEIVELNVMSHLRAARAAIPPMRRQKSGVILFNSSLFGREGGGPNLSIYNTTKSALISAAKVMAQELAPDGIRVLSFAPGSIRFPGGSWDRRVKEDPEGMAIFVKENMPLGRFGTAEEVAAVVTFLASDRASLMTGACIAIDGSQGHSLI